jgi:hypothetical protein
MTNFKARCTSLKYGKPYDHGVNLLLLIMYFCIETAHELDKYYMRVFEWTATP